MLDLEASLGGGGGARCELARTSSVRVTVQGPVIHNAPGIGPNGHIDLAW